MFHTATTAWRPAAIAAVALLVALLSIPVAPARAVEFNQDLPLGGLFYGNAFHGDAVGNTRFRKAAAFRFRAERTGTVRSVTFNNRYNQDTTNDNRKPGGYSKGDGGRVFVEVQTNDLDNLPSGTSLGKTRTYTPVRESQNLTLEFKPQPRLKAGEIYYIVLHQTNRSSGVVSVNNIHVHTPLRPVVGGPYLGNDFMLFTDQGDGWIQRPDAELQKIPTFQITYTDGVSVGTGYNGSGIATREIGGPRMARQTFTVERPTRRVDGVWIRLGRRSNNGTDLTVRLEHGSTLLESVTVPERNVSYTSGSLRDAQIHWFYVPFTRTHELTTGQRYHLVLQAPSNARYLANSLKTMTVQRWTDRNMWTSARAEYSTNGGRSWSNFHSRVRATDLSVLFTLEGGPRSVSIIDGQPILGDTTRESATGATDSAASRQPALSRPAHPPAAEAVLGVRS